MDYETAIREIAGVLLDHECEECEVDTATEPHDEGCDGEPYDMSVEDAYETLHNAVALAREALGEH